MRCVASSARIVFQFTPLREGRPISCAEKPRMFISIHAPPRGATSAPDIIIIIIQHFNSRPSARGDEAQRPRIVSVEAISIHAPPRGAT